MYNYTADMMRQNEKKKNEKLKNKNRFVRIGVCLSCKVETYAQLQNK